MKIVKSNMKKKNQNKNGSRRIASRSSDPYGVVWMNVTS